MEYREATARDVDAIAGLHADSWRLSYRGPYSDEFLDGDVGAERLAAWTERLVTKPATDSTYTILAERDGVLVGFAHTILDDDPKWGALLDNLHVRHELQGAGIGTRLLSETATAVIERTPSAGLYLWVLEQNTAARAFYEARGGSCVGRGVAQPPGGGTAAALRYAWRDPAELLVT